MARELLVNEGSDIYQYVLRPATLLISAVFASALLLLFSQGAGAGPETDGIPKPGPQVISGALLHKRRIMVELAHPTPRVMAELDQQVLKKPCAEVFFHRAILRYKNKQNSLALLDCEESLKRQKSQAAYDLFCRCCLQEGAWSKVIGAASKMARTNPEAGFSFEYSTFAAALAGDFDQSTNELAAYTAHSLIIGAVRRCGFDAGSIGTMTNSELTPILEKFSKTDKQKQHKQLILALDAHIRGKYGESQALLKSLADPQRSPSHGLTDTDDLAQALSICNCLRLSPSICEDKSMQFVQRTRASKAAISLLDTTYFVLGQRDKSLTFISKLIDQEQAAQKGAGQNAKLVDLFLTRADINEQLGNAKAALDDCQAAVKLQSGNKKARLQAYRYMLILGDKSVKTELDRYLKEYTGDGVAYFLRAHLLVLDKKWQQAAGDLSGAIDDGYYLIKALQARSACYRALHKDGLADADAELAEISRWDNIFVREFNEPTLPDTLVKR